MILDTGKVTICLVAMIERLKKFLDEGGEYAALITDLSKALDCFAITC